MEITSLVPGKKYGTRSRRPNNRDFAGYKGRKEANRRPRSERPYLRSKFTMLLLETDASVKFPCRTLPCMVVPKEEYLICCTINNSRTARPF